MMLLESQGNLAISTERRGSEYGVREGEAPADPNAPGVSGIPSESPERNNGNAEANEPMTVETRSEAQSARNTGKRAFWSQDETIRLIQEDKALRAVVDPTRLRRLGGDQYWIRLAEQYERVRLLVNRIYQLDLPQREAGAVKSKLVNRLPVELKNSDRRVWPRVGLAGVGSDVHESEMPETNERSEELGQSSGTPADAPAEAERVHVVDDTEASSPEDGSVVVEERFRQQFNHYRKVFMERNSTWRKPLKFPRKVPGTLWTQANSLIGDVLRSGVAISLHDLNKLAYAAACTVQHFLKEKDRLCLERERNWFAAREVETNSLLRYLNWIDVELARRRVSARQTTHQRWCSRQLKTRYGRERIADTGRLKELRSMLRDALAGVRKSVAKRKADRERKRAKFVPLRRYLEKGPEVEPQLDANRVKEYWAELVGADDRSDSRSITADWAHDLEVPVQTATPSKIQVWWKMALSKCKPNKAAGPDGLPGCVWKCLPNASNWLCTWLIKKLACSRIDTPRWLSEGRVVLLMKKGDPNDPANYRPIACLNTCYKLMTSVIERAIREQVTACPTLIPSEQVANRKGVWGCTHASIVDRLVTGTAAMSKGQNADLRVLFYDCKKAFDSVSRDHMFRVLDVAGVDRKIYYLLKSFTMNWTVRYELRRSGRVERSAPLRVKRGLLQGDSLSPTWFCLCIAPISHALRLRNPGPCIRQVAGHSDGGQVHVSHLFYMDDLKVYCTGEAAQVRAERLVPELFSQIGLCVNESKSAAAAGPSRTLRSSLPLLGVKDQYKYLGIESGFVANEASAYSRMQTTILAKVQSILDVEGHTVGQRRIAIRTVAFPGAAFILGNIILGDKQPNSAKADMLKLDMVIREKIRRKGLLHHSCANPRIYLSCKRGGLEWPSMFRTYCAAVAYSSAYLLTSGDPWVKRAQEHFVYGTLAAKNQVYKHLLYVLGELEIGRQVIEPPWGNDPKALARKLVLAIDTKIEENYLRDLRAMPRAGRFVNAESSAIDQENSHLWLEKGWINGKAYQHINSVIEGTLLEGVNPHNVLEKCRACGNRNADIIHITSGCERLRETIMKTRHDGATRWLYSALTEVDESLPRFHYTQQIDGLAIGNRLEIRYDIDVVTPNRPKHCRPDLVVFDKQRKEIFIVEVSVSWFTIVQKMYENKYCRYAVNSNHEYSEHCPYPPGVNLANELRVMYPQYVNGVKVLPLVITPTGHIHNEFVPHLRMLLQQSNVSKIVERIQRSVVLGTDYIIRTYFAMLRKH
ncbi:unnamed protein product [Bursaphelenchus xylophilus]|uniref:(pine wood nematode) hypothetical protein n=1 Tax=Bursaphelenchus xylophilus TaxID=6326 RepID=A0A1I7S6I3_BURXY|nr:unnamed protein product [Bursaphelenchus xylophilus]CAD5229727.1 unnamed protein product [Bursaphelenchus xylophilus]CAG9120451.1 unnamed protein product [Bursaphelenchus xylophilus]CAG9120460.1 unnamed protein product [Bursaphelenchus xylophilus]